MTSRYRSFGKGRLLIAAYVPNILSSWLQLVSTLIKLPYLNVSMSFIIDQMNKYKPEI